MRNFIKTGVIGVSIIIAASVAQAKDLAIGKAKSVVYVQEITSTFQVLFNVYCPVTEKRRFVEFCKKSTQYNLKQPIINKNVDWLKVDKFKYMVQWVPAKPSGTYAWVSATGGLSRYSLTEETLLAKFAPGTVIVESLFTKMGKAKRDAAVKRTKAAMKQKYGSIVDKMKFVHVKSVKVTCTKRKDAAKNGTNCAL